MHNPETMMINGSLMKKAPALLLSLICLTILPVVRAQQNDFQSWPSAGLNINLPGKFRATLEEEVRLKENCTQLDRQSNSLGIGYRFNKFVRTAVYYRLEAKQDHPGMYTWRHGVYADLSLKYTAGAFSFDYRTRLQSARVEFNPQGDRLDSRFTHRHKAGCTYELENLPVDLSVEGELFYKTGKGYPMSAYRVWAGIAWKPGKQHEFSLKYGIDREVYEPDPLTAYIIALDYTYNIKL
jgi:hypothetical protein